MVSVSRPISRERGNGRGHYILSSCVCFWDKPKLNLFCLCTYYTWCWPKKNFLDDYRCLQDHLQSFFFIHSNVFGYQTLLCIKVHYLTLKVRCAAADDDGQSQEFFHSCTSGMWSNSRTCCWMKQKKDGWVYRHERRRTFSNMGWWCYLPKVKVEQLGIFLIT